MASEQTAAWSAPSSGAIMRSHGRMWLIGGALLLLMLAMTAGVEYALGRTPICKCGTIKFWHGVVVSSENSQHLTDWYTFSHIVHGLLFYFAAWAIAKWRRRAIGVVPALVAATFVEAAWEIFENTDFVINRYREVTISLDYYGDSIINSVCDIIAMMAGFAVARTAPVIVSILLAVGLELFAAVMIRDNLVLNIIMLIHPLEFIKVWQNGG
ncbi:MAG: DUF2585 family protein [Hyphomicrobiales bacterium]|nr:DUF2585 family protein [Hyphomicrobiales bacterium]